MQKNTMILKLRAALDYHTFRVNPGVFRVQEEWLAATLACSLPHGTHWEHQDTPAAGEPSWALCRNSKIWASSSCRSKPIDTGKIVEQSEVLRKEPRNCSIPTLHFARNVATWNRLYRTGGTHSQNCMMEHPRNQISELHFDKFPDASAFQWWKTNF